MILVHLKKVTILPSGSVYFAIRGKNGKMVSTKLLPLMHCKKVGYFFKNWGNSLGKIPQNQWQLLPWPRSGEVLHGTYPKPKCFTPFARTPLRLTSE